VGAREAEARWHGGKSSRGCRFCSYARYMADPPDLNDDTTDMPWVLAPDHQDPVWTFEPPGHGAGVESRTEDRGGGREGPG
jgi:hypothetical protein